MILPKTSLLSQESWQFPITYFFLQIHHFTNSITFPEHFDQNQIPWHFHDMMTFPWHLSFSQVSVYTGNSRNYPEYCANSWKTNYFKWLTLFKLTILFLNPSNARQYLCEYGIQKVTFKHHNKVICTENPSSNSFFTAITKCRLLSNLNVAKINYTSKFISWTDTQKRLKWWGYIAFDLIKLW